MNDGASDSVNVLLVDDLDSRLLSYEVILGTLGENLVRATSGVAALERLMKDDFAVILLDVSMPDMDGFETAALIREHPRFAKTPIIFVTGFNVTDFDRLRGYELGAVDYVYVPVIPEILRGKVSVLVELYRQRRELVRLNRRLGQANADLARANDALQAEKARELDKLNEVLKRSNTKLELANRALRTEVAERTRLDDALREADRRKDEFLAMLAHELRNPLAPILNSVHLMKTSESQDPELAWCRSVIERQVGHLARLVDDLLDVARVTQGKIGVRVEETDLSAVVTRAVEASRAAIEAGAQTLTVAVPAEPVKLSVDPVRIAQVISNLLSNAAKYSEPGGEIRLAATVEPLGETGAAHVEIRVTDSGIGIAKDLLPQVFEPFVQADHSLTRSRGGLGVGLTLVKRLVEAHGGTVSAESGGPGHGSEFTVRLPLCPPPAHDPRVEVSPLPTLTSAPGRRRVLVVDDNVESAQTMSLLVRKLGHEAATAYDGVDAVDAAGKFRPDIVLLDIGLPKLDGYEVARRIRLQPDGRAVTLVALTGWGQQQDRRRSSEAGFDQHLVKPVDLPALEQALVARPGAARRGPPSGGPAGPRAQA